MLAQRRYAPSRERVARWKADHAPVVEWLERSTTPYADSLKTQLAMYGRLSDGQCMAVMKIVGEEREDALRAKRVSQITELDIAAAAVTHNTTPLLEVFETALKNGIKRPKVWIGELVFKLAPATGKNPGALYVNGPDGLYYGKIVNGKFHRQITATGEVIKLVEELMADPLASMVAYGKRTGMCCLCHKTLTNPESIEAGIGPICRDNFGFRGF